MGSLRVFKVKHIVMGDQINSKRGERGGGMKEGDWEEEWYKLTAMVSNHRGV